MAQQQSSKRIRISAADRPRTKSQVYGEIAENTGLTRRQISEVFDTMSAIIKKDLGRNGPGTFSVPGMMKIAVQRKPAVAARQGINPFTGEETIFKAKAARNVVKVRPLKGLKDLV